MDLLDRAEIISGPGAALCGNNACLAVINLVTRHADKIGRGELSLGGGTHGSVDGPTRRVTEGAGRTSPGCGHDSVTFTLAGSSRKRDLRSFSLFVARPGV